MAKYEIVIEEELNRELSDIARASGISVEDLIHEFISLHLEKEKVGLIIKQYKEGNMKAREAWKLTGLSYQEFQNLVNN